MNYHLYADDTQLYLPFQSSVVHEAEAAKVKMEACIQDIIISGCHPTCSNSCKTELLVLNAKCRRWPPTTFVSVCDDIIMPSIRARNNYWSSVWLVFVIGETHQYNFQSCTYYSTFVTSAETQDLQSQLKLLVHALITSRIDFCNTTLYGVPLNLLQKC